MRVRVRERNMRGDAGSPGQQLTAVFLKLPLSVVQRAHLPRLQPPRDTVKVKGVVAHAPCHHALV